MATTFNPNINNYRNQIASGQMTPQQALDSIQNEWISVSKEQNGGGGAYSSLTADQVNNIKKVLFAPMQINAGGRSGTLNPSGDISWTTASINQTNVGTSGITNTTGYATPSSGTTGVNSYNIPTPITTGGGTTQSNPVQNTIQPPTVSLQPGSTDTTNVKKLQDYLVSQGVMTADQRSTGYGTYGPQTTAAVKALQSKLGVDNYSGPGFWGPKTISAVQTNTSTSSSNNSSGTQGKTLIGTYGGTTASPTLMNVYSDGTTAPANTQTGTNTSSGTTTPGQATSFYGRNQDTAVENRDLQETSSIGTNAVNAGFINSNTLASITSDPSVLAFYVHALAYGGYTIGDVLNDMKRRELASQGNVQASNLVIIDPTQQRSTYLTSAAGQQSTNLTQSIIPTANLQGLLNPAILQYGSNMPDDLFKELVPISDPNSQTFKDAVAGIKSDYTDLMNQLASAQTEQEKTIADANYAEWTKELNTKYGVTLSNNAATAWKQISDLEKQGTSTNFSSDVGDSAISKVLQGTARADKLQRDQKQTDSDNQMKSTYQSSATPAQIQALIAEDQAKGLPQNQWRATLWGLIPSANVQNEYSMATLQSKFPDKTVAELQDIRNTILDENGNYRSAIYAKYYSTLQTNNANALATAKNTVTTNAANQEAQAYKSMDSSNPLNVMPSGTGTGAGTGANNSSVSQPQTPASQPQTPAPVTPPTPQPQTPAPATGRIYTYADGSTGSTLTPAKSLFTGGSATTAATTKASPSTYSVVSGDTLGAIAAKNNTTVANLAKLNNISDPNKISVGQSIKFS